MPKSVTGFVETITSDVTKSGKNAGAKYWKLKLRGLDDTFFVWQWPIIADVNKGQEVDLAIDDSGDARFQRVIECVPVIREGVEPPQEKTIEAPSPAPRPVSENQYQPKGSRSDNNPYIARMSALKTAVEFLNAKDIGATMEDVVACAMRFNTYIERGE